MTSFLLFSLIFLTGGYVLAEEGSDNALEEEVKTLRQQIDEKNSELEMLEKQRLELENKLKETGEKKSSLQQDLSSINWQIDQLQISIRSNSLTIEKLRLERESLGEDIKDIEEDIRNKKDTAGRLLVELQQRDSESFLAILLKHRTLSESVSEIQSIMTLGDDLTRSANELKDLQTDLIKKSNQVKTKEQSMEIEQRTLENRQGLIADQKDQKQYLLAQTKSEEQEYEERIAEVERQQMEISDVMSVIEERLRLTLDPSLLPAKRPGLLAFPVKSDSCITQYYGNTSFAKQAYGTKFHTGLDFRAPLGDPIFAAADGKVAVVENNDKSTWRKYQYGMYIIIEHNNNLSTLYAHLSRQVVREGATVAQGQIIGYSGNTGYSFGAHLHFGVYPTPVSGWRKSYSAEKARENGGLIEIPPANGLVPVGATIDPSDYLPSMKNC